MRSDGIDPGSAICFFYFILTFEVSNVTYCNLYSTVFVKFSKRSAIVDNIWSVLSEYKEKTDLKLGIK